jgi:hypothetical protein
MFKNKLIKFVFIILSYSSNSLCLEKFGSQGPFVKIDSVKKISSSEFFDQYVKTKRALLLQDAIKPSPAFKLWASDEYLQKIAAPHDDFKILIETQKKESRDQDVTEMSMRDFLDVYKQKELYMVSQVPFYLRKEIVLPLPLQCEQAADTLEETIMWFSSGGTKSVVHTDDYENILCVIDGVKELVLVDYYKYKNIIDVM